MDRRPPLLCSKCSYSLGTTVRCSECGVDTAIPGGDCAICRRAWITLFVLVVLTVVGQWAQEIYFYLFFFKTGVLEYAQTLPQNRNKSSFMLYLLNYKPAWLGILRFTSFAANTLMLAYLTKILFLSEEWNSHARNKRAFFAASAMIAVALIVNVAQQAWACASLLMK